MPIIIGKPFLATSSTLIAIQEGKLTFRINDKELVFYFDSNKDLHL